MGTLRLERWKFLVYLIAPVAAVYLFSLPEVHETAIKSRRYIVYQPGRGVKPMSEDSSESVGHAAEVKRAEAAPR